MRLCSGQGSTPLVKLSARLKKGITPLPVPFMFLRPPGEPDFATILKAKNLRRVATHQEQALRLEQGQRFWRVEECQGCRSSEVQVEQQPRIRAARQSIPRPHEFPPPAIMLPLLRNPNQSLSGPTSGWLEGDCTLISGGSFRPAKRVALPANRTNSAATSGGMKTS